MKLLLQFARNDRGARPQSERVRRDSHRHDSCFAMAVMNILRTPLLLSAFAIGCAHSSAWRAASPGGDQAQFAAAYEAVRSGKKPSAQIGDVLYCETRRGLTILLPARGMAYEGADPVQDQRLAETVQEIFASDSRLGQEPIKIKAYRGEVILTGQVQSDSVAIRVIDSALRAPGVRQVNAELTSPESPGPVAHDENRLDPDCPL